MGRHNRPELLTSASRSAICLTSERILRDWFVARVRCPQRVVQPPSRQSLAPVPGEWLHVGQCGGPLLGISCGLGRSRTVVQRVTMTASMEVRPRPSQHCSDWGILILESRSSIFPTSSRLAVAHWSGARVAMIVASSQIFRLRGFGFFVAASDYRKAMVSSSRLKEIRLGEELVCWGCQEEKGFLAVQGWTPLHR